MYHEEMSVRELVTLDWTFTQLWSSWEFLLKKGKWEMSIIIISGLYFRHIHTFVKPVTSLDWCLGRSFLIILIWNTISYWIKEAYDSIWSLNDSACHNTHTMYIERLYECFCSPLSREWHVTTIPDLSIYTSSQMHWMGHILSAVQDIFSRGK